MVWKSREDKLPPPSFFSLIVAHLQQAYRGAKISREMMTALRPFFIEAWRNGKTAEAAAQSTCSCDGHEVVPSPVIGVHITKGSVRPPKGAQRGEVFGADALRPPAAIERLQKKLGRIEQAKRREETAGDRWERRAQSARKDASRAEASRKQGAATSRFAALKEEAEKVEADIQRLRTELNRASKVAPHVTPPKAEAMPAPAAPPPSPKSGAAKRRRASAATGAPEAAAVSPSEGDAMLSAIRVMLPDLANQLASQMAQQGPKK